MKNILLNSALLSFAMLFGSFEISAQHWSQQNTNMAGSYTCVTQVSIVDSNIIWVNGANGSGHGRFIQAMSRTKDKGATWSPGSYTGFGANVRAVVLCGVSYYKAFCVAFDTASVMGSFWKTIDGGASWTTVSGVLNNGTSSFADGVYFWDHGKGFCYGDPVNNHFEIYITSDSGTTWTSVDTTHIPVSVAGEYGYNGASCASIVAGGIGFFVTNHGRVFKTLDYGATWTLTPIAPYNTVAGGGIYASNANYVITGCYPSSASTVKNWKYTSNGGTIWDTLNASGNFYQYQLCYVPGTPNMFVATSPSTLRGVGYSNDGGLTWTDFTDTTYLQPGGSNIQCLGVGFYNNEMGWVGNFNQAYNSILKYSSLSAVASAIPTTICSGSSQLDVNVSGGTSYAYSWASSPAGFTSALQNPVVSPTVTTTYNVTVTSGPNSATSSVNITVIPPYLPVSINISANPSGAICTGTSVTFTSTTANGGTPAYQWKVNGLNAGINSPSFVSSTLVNGDIVTCVLTSSLSCALGNPATSNAITITESSSLPVSINVLANPSGAICSGWNVTYTASPVNGGDAPAYQWRVNGLNVGINNPTYTSSTLSDGDAVTCELTSALSCAAGNPAISNAIVVSVEEFCPWKQTGGPYNGTIICLAISGINIFAATNEGVYFSSNNGGNWSAVNNGLTDSLTVNALVISGANIFAGTSGGVYLSSDNGSSWTAVNAGLTNTDVRSLAIKGSDILAGTLGGVFLSSNNGGNWTVRNISTIVYTFAISGNNIFAGTPGGLFLSTDNGITWTKRDNGIPYPVITALAISGDTLYAGNLNDGGYWSTNSGLNWSRFMAVANPNVRAFAISGSKVYAGTGTDNYCYGPGGIYLTSNHGSSWSALYLGINGTYITALAISGNNIFAGTDGAGVLLSTNNGATWNAVNAGFPYTKALSLTIYGSNMFAGTVDGVFSTSDNGGIWTGRGLPEDTIDAVAIKGSYVFAGSGGDHCNSIGGWGGWNTDIYLSANNGCSWYTTTGVLLNVLSFAISGNNIFAVAAGGVHLSTNNGNSWIAVNTGLPSNTCIFTLAISGSNIFLGTGDGVYLSANNGSSWNAANNGIAVNDEIYTIAISGSNIFAGTVSGVYVSINNGNSWTLMNNGLEANTEVLALAVSGSNIIAGTNGGGVFLSTGIGNSWIAANEGLTETIVNALAIIGDTLFAATASGVWERKLSDIITGNKEQTKNENNISVYPNPATDNLNIEASPPAVIKITNIQGQLIKTLSSSDNITYVDVSAFPGGMYFVEVKTENGVEVEKFLKE